MVKPSKPVEKEKEVVEEPKEAPIPTAMEMAMREAMERSSVQLPPPSQKAKRRNKNNSSDEIEDILERTLQNKVRTGR